MINKYEKGSGCYTCLDCGKKTRETGEGESGCKLCRDCYESAGLENEHNDTGGHDRSGQNLKLNNCPLCK